MSIMNFQIPPPPPPQPMNHHRRRQIPLLYPIVEQINQFFKVRGFGLEHLPIVASYCDIILGVALQLMKIKSYVDCFFGIIARYDSNVVIGQINLFVKDLIETNNSQTQVHQKLSDIISTIPNNKHVDILNNIVPFLQFEIDLISLLKSISESMLKKNYDSISKSIQNIIILFDQNKSFFKI
ncbi:hypothetical protein DFA_09446 [Cavenderia fasciculata]|uniref:Uncharacterized protein n=1 Tax=Cavenderia fasciculata TaxID=261658 RepID=F4Q7M9_CACFS|nr:uncharacterized protein DFA_09446 [Cavenderia fasciculata]EGG16411.1 hypothetical protein DFA_09446 [Cavenderia fasciculata]|eukprot:XP_004354795.1 hypothetical protein DFA_09446 [Cavenderia fasciculata]